MRVERQKDSRKIDTLLPTIPNYISEYIQVSLDRLTPTTVLSYLRDIQDFLEWTWHSFFPEKPSIKSITLEDLGKLIELDVSHYRAYLKHREDSHNRGKRYYKTANSDKTISRKISALKSLFEYLMKHTNRDTGKPYLSKNIFEDIKVPISKVSVQVRAEKLKKSIIQLDELDEFQEYIFNTYGVEERKPMEKTYWKKNRYRDAAIISILLTSGIRVGELSSLRLKDLVLEERRLFIERKRNKEDIAYFSHHSLELLKEYLKVRETLYHADDNPNSPLFVSKYRGQANAFSKNAIQKMIIKYAKAYGKPDLTAHILRHSFGTNVFKKTKNIRGVQEALGHSNIETTTIYTHMFDDEKRNLVDDVFE